MKKLQYSIFIIFSIFLLYNVNIKAQPKEGDRILAIVGYEIILESDLQYQLQSYAKQNQLTQINPMIAQQIFQQMLTEKILYSKAEQDSITVKDDEINKELEYRIKSLVEQFGSEKKIEELYGMSITKIRLTLKDDLIKKMKTDKVKRKKFQGGIKVTEKEIRDFFTTYKDSLPSASLEYELSHIYLSRKVSEAEKSQAKEIANKILDSIKNGVDFSELAKRNSDDKGSAINGGDLGFSKKGVFVKEFEEALYLLNAGEISGLVETEFGFHIIKLIEKKGESVHPQHILVAYPKLESSDLETIVFLKDLKNKIETNQISFEDAVKQYSQDVTTNLKNGYLGFIPVERLDSNMVITLNLLNIGELSKPLKSGDDKTYGYEIVKVLSKNPEHKLSLETDYEKIKKFALMFKENSEMDKWVEELKKSIFVDVKY